MFAKSYNIQSHFRLIFHALIIFFPNALPLKKKITCLTILHAIHFCPVNVLCLFMIQLFISLVDDTVICHLTCHLLLINLNCALRDQFCHPKMAQRVCKCKKYQKSVPKSSHFSWSDLTDVAGRNHSALTLLQSLKYKAVVFNVHIF